MKWTMHSATHFSFTDGKYVATVRKTRRFWEWEITKGPEMINCVYYYSHTPSGELDAKNWAERAYKHLKENE